MIFFQRPAWKNKNNFSLLDVLFVFLALFSIVLFIFVMWENAAQASVKPSVQRWEYQCMNVRSEVTAHANRLGKKGWEMVSAAALPAHSQRLWDGSLSEVTARFADEERALAALRESTQPLMVWCFKRRF